MSVDQHPERASVAHEHAGWARSRLHVVLVALGPLAGVLAGAFVYDRGWTLPGAFMTFGVVTGAVGWALPEAIMGPRRIARVTFVLLPMATGVAGFALASLAWGPTWPALVVGSPLGSVLGTNLRREMFPDLAREVDVRWLGDVLANGVAVDDECGGLPTKMHPRPV